MAEESVVKTLVSTAPRIPEFDSDDPELWFTRVESIFIRRGVSDSVERYLEVISVLPARYAKEVRDVIMRPADKDSYSCLKEQLIRRLGSSQEEKTRQLLESATMGSDKPSQFLRRMQALAGSDVPESMIRGLWIRRLPEKLQPTLATQKNMPIADAAELADTVFDLLPASNVIAEAATPPQDSATNQSHPLYVQLATMQKQISQLTQQIAGISVSNGQRRDSSRCRHRSRSRSRSRGRDPPPGLCWYHWRFESRARKCVKPCNWQPGNETGGR